MKEFILMQAENGGWVIRLGGDSRHGLVPVIVGAYTNTPDALAGMAKIMSEESQK